MQSGIAVVERGTARDNQMRDGLVMGRCGILVPGACGPGRRAAREAWGRDGLGRAGSPAFRWQRRPSRSSVGRGWASQGAVERKMLLRAGGNMPQGRDAVILCRLSYFRVNGTGTRLKDTM